MKNKKLLSYCLSVIFLVVSPVVSSVELLQKQKTTGQFADLRPDYAVIEIKKRVFPNSDVDTYSVVIANHGHSQIYPQGQVPRVNVLVKAFYVFDVADYPESIIEEHTESIENLKAGESTTLTFSLINEKKAPVIDPVTGPVYSKDLWVVVVVDPANRIKEQNEDNNIISCTRFDLCY